LIPEPDPTPQLFALDFTKKSQKTISPYYQSQIDFMKNTNGKAKQ